MTARDPVEHVRLEDSIAGGPGFGQGLAEGSYLENAATGGLPGIIAAVILWPFVRLGKIMWGEVVSADGFHVMAYDVPSATAFDQREIAYFVSVRGKSTDEISGYWDKLSAQGTIKAPLAPAGFSPLYGMVTDQFGVTWVLDVAVEYAPS